MAIIDSNAGTWTAAQLLEDVRQKARIPPGTLDYTDNVLLEEATRGIWSFAGWAMSKASDGRLLGILQRASATAFSTPYAVGREVDLPVDAVGDTFDSVFWVNANGIETRLRLLDLAQEPIYDTPLAQGEPWWFSVVDGRLRIYPLPSPPGSVRINYQRRLPRLVASDSTDVGVITASSTTSTSLTINAGASFSVAVGRRVDVISQNYPYRYAVPNILVTSLALPAFTSTGYTATTCPYPATNELVGAYAVTAGCSPFVHLPLEFKQCLTQKIAAQILGEIGDAQGAALLEQKAEAELARVLHLLSPRSQTTRNKVINQYSLMRTRARSWRWGGMW